NCMERLDLEKEINKRLERVIDCCVQVNVIEEDTKHGLRVEEVPAFIEQMQGFDNIHLVGLMTMALHVEDEERIRSVFRQLADLRDKIKEKGYPHAPCHYLSMGMSNDYEIAVEEGAKI